MNAPQNEENSQKPDYANIGRVFTPIEWAEWVLSRFNIHQQWKDGATVIDPTCGQGVFLLALVKMSLKEGRSPTPEELSRLTGVEVMPEDKRVFLSKMKSECGIEFPESNFHTQEFLNFKSESRHDIAVGNPPWINFTDLDPKLKEPLKQVYVKYGLVKKANEVFLGGSRQDFSAIIIMKCMTDDVKENGSGYFFIPMSLFFNEGAHRNFRPVEGEDNVFSVTNMYDFEPSMVFPNVSTRYGFVVLKRGVEQSFPVSMVRMKLNGNSESQFCSPDSKKGAWIQHKSEKPDEFPKIIVNSNQTPRQGMNTCGLNKAFIFNRLDEGGDDSNTLGRYVNGYGLEFELPNRFLARLLKKEDFGEKGNGIDKFILCLYKTTKAPMTEKELRKSPELWQYLCRYKTEMQARKGLVIRSFVQRGLFWALMGVGAYCFTKYKVVWIAQGRRQFKAVVVDGSQQGNQAMHAYIPSESLEDAIRIRDELNAIIPEYLSKYGMDGTKSWAQPSRIKNLLTFPEEDQGD